MNKRAIHTLVWVCGLAALLAAPASSPASDLPTRPDEPAYIGNDPDVPDTKEPAAAHPTRGIAVVETARPQLESRTDRGSRPLDRELLRLVRILSRLRWGGLVR